MTKIQLTTFIMAQTNEYKKTNLMKMHIADLEVLAQPFQSKEPLIESPQLTLCEPLVFETIEQVESTEILSQEPAGSTIYTLVEETYDKHKKLVKGPRLDKEEFRTTAIAKIIDALATAESADVDHITIQVITTLLENKTYFCPINDVERLMLSTIPQMKEFHGMDSILEGKGFLEKVNELHGIAISTSRALMVSLCKKGFYEIKGKKSGQKHTTLHLKERGIKYLQQTAM